MEQVLDSAAMPPVPASEEDRIYRRLTWRIVPFLFVCLLAAYLDRVNVGFAKLQMSKALGFSETVYGAGAGIFFVGYVLFEVPSNLILVRTGPRIWIARIMITWGLICALMAFVTTPFQFYALRFLLGVAEAGFAPGVLLYLTYWFPGARRARITAIFLAAIPAASIVGGPLSGWIFKTLDGAQGLAGWQWLFVVETIPSLLLGVATLLWLDDRVEDARWLGAEERRLVASQVAREAADKEDHSRLGAAFRDARVWMLGGIYFMLVCGIYIVAFWLPTLIKQTGVADPLTIGLLTAVPSVIAIVAMALVSIDGDRRRERRWHTALPMLAAGIGLAITGYAGSNIALALLGLSLAAAGASSAQPSFWCLPPAFLGGAAAAAGLALVNSIGNIAGFASTYFVGWSADLTGSSRTALYVFAAIVATGGVLVLAVPKHLVDK